MKTLGLDIGSTEFRSLWRDGNRLIARQVPAVYCILDDTPVNRRLCEQSLISVSQAEGSLIVMGRDAHEISSLLHCPLVPVIYEGHLPWEDPVGRQVCSALVDSLVTPVRESGAVCSVTLPPYNQKSTPSDGQFWENLLSLRGYQVKYVNSATAVVLSELQVSGFSGVGVAVGAESVSLSICRQGRPLFEGVYARGLRSVEKKYAQSRHRYRWGATGDCYLDLQALPQMTEQGMSLTSPKSGDELWVVKQWRDLLADAWNSMLPELIRIARTGIFRQPFSAVISGGVAHYDGFSDLIRHSLEHCGIPLRVQEIRTAHNRSLSVARGLLVHSTLAADQFASSEPVAA